ncbi:MAG: type II toxin-antitoxin system RelE/ParE family toxin [Firmicutes bacterium]|nr:type II toxin-antitoxin system RelE/ParE family toxin [Bacillota bacterium]
MYNLVLSKRAELELDTLQEYADSHYYSKRILKLEDDLDYCFDRLRNNPYFYQQCFQPKLEAKGYRRAVVQDFILVYHVDEDKKEVNVIGAFHGRQNYTEYL